MPDRKDKKEKVTDPALLALLNGDDSDVAVADKGKVTDPDLLAQLNGEETTPQKKSPVASEPTSATPSQEQQGGVSATPNSSVPGFMGEIQAFSQRPTDAPAAATPAEDSKIKTHQATEFIANHYLQNNAPSAGDITTGLDNLTSPHSDPSYLADYKKNELNKLQSDYLQKRQGLLQMRGGDILAERKKLDEEYQQQKDAITTNADQILATQLFTKEYQDKRMTPGEAKDAWMALEDKKKTYLDPIDKQLEDVQKQLAEVTKSAGPLGAKKTKSSSGLTEPELNHKFKELTIAKFNAEKEYNKQAAEINSNTKYNPIEIGAEFASYSGEPHAAEDLMALRKGRSIDPARQYKYNVQGDKIMQTGLANVANEDVKNEVSPYVDQTGERRFHNNKPYIINKLGNQRYEDESKWRWLVPSGKWTPELVEEYGQKIGLNSNQIEELKKNPDEIPKSVTGWQQFIKGVADASITPIHEQGAKMLGRLGGVPAEMMNKDFHPGWENERGVSAFVAGNTPSEQNKFDNFRGFTGNVLGALGSLVGLTGEVGAVSKGMKMAGIGESAATKLANFGVMSFNGYNDAYNHSLEVIGDKPEDENARQIFSTINGILGGAIYSYSPKTKLLSGMMGIEENKVGVDLLKGIQKNGIDFLKTPTGKDVVLKYVQGTAKELGTQVGLADAVKLSEDITNAIANPNIKQSIPEDLLNTTTSTMVGMLIPSIIGAHSHIKSESPQVKALMFEAGSKPDVYIKQISQMLEDGQMSPENAQTAHDAILTMKNVIANTPTKNALGQDISPDNIKDYAYDMMQEHILQKKIDEVTEKATSAGLQPEKAQLAPLDKSIKELQKDREKIITTPIVQAKLNQAPADERSVATNLESEPQTSATKEKTEEKVANTEKENIPLIPQEDQTLKNNDHGSEQSNERRQSNPTNEDGKGSEEETRLREAANSNGGQEQEDNRLTREEQKQKARDAIKRRKLKPDMPVSDSPEAKSGEIPVVKKEAKEKSNQGTEPSTERRNDASSEPPASANKEFTPPQPEKPLHEMTGQELSDYHDKLKKHNKELDKNVLGDKYEEYSKAQRVSESLTASKEARDKADKTINEIEASLTEVQRKALFAEDVPEGHIVNEEEVREYRDKVQLIESSQSEGELARSVANSLIELNSAPKDVSKMTEKQKQALSAMIAAKRVIEERGYDGKKVTQEALKNAADKFGDKNDAEFMLSKYLDFKQEKPQDHASTQSQKQLKESNQQSSQPEHARVEQARGKEKTAQPTGGNSNQRGKKKEKVKSASNRHQMDFATYNANKKLVEESGIEPRTLEEATLLHMAGGGKFIEGPLDGNNNPTGIAKHLSTRPGAEEYEAAREKWLAPHGSESKVYDKKLKKNVDAVNADKFGYEFNDKGDENEGQIGQIISDYPTQGRVYDRLAEIVRERNKEDKPPEQTYDITTHDLQTGDKEIISLDPGDPNFENKVASIMGMHPDDMPVSFTDEGHPIFEEGLQQHKTIQDVELTKEQVQTLYDLWDKHTGDDGKLNSSAFAEDLAASKESFDKTTQELIEKIGVFNSDEENEPHIQKLNQKVKDYETTNSKRADEATPEGPSGKSSADDGQPGGVEEGGGEKPKPAERTTGEKLNQAPADERSVATNPSSETELLKQKEEKTDLVKKKTEALNKLKEQHDDLTFQKEELETKLDNAFAKSKVDPQEVEALEKEISDIRQEVAAKKKALDQKAREVEIQKGYAKGAEKIRKLAEKINRKGEAYSSVIPGLTPKNVALLLDHVADVYEKFGNLHIAALKGLEWAKEQFKDEKDIDLINEGHIKDLLGPHTEPLHQEPIIKDADHLQYAKDLLKDIQDGVVDYDQARQEIMGSEGVYDKTKGNVLNYIDYHLESQESTSIRNATTRLRREQFGLEEEIPAAKKEFGETWDEAKGKIENGYNPQDLIDGLVKHPRPLTDVENAIILHHQNAKEIEILDLNKSINKAAEDGDAGSAIEAKVAKARVFDELQRIYDVNKAVGTENARGLASRRMMVDRKYSLVNMIAEKRATSNEGQPLSEEQQAHIESLHQKIHETQEAFDNYVKQKQQEILDLQRKVLAAQQEKAQRKSEGATNPNASEAEKKQTASKKIADKLRSWADKIEGSTKNQAYSSPIPVTPKMVADALRFVADGVEKGGDIIDYVQKAIGKAKADNPSIDESHLEGQLNQALIDAGVAEQSNEANSAIRKIKLMSPFFKDGKLDREATRLNVAANRAKAEFDHDILREKEKQLSKAAKIQNTFIKWQRMFKLSNPITLGKLAMAGMTRLATTPLEDVVGGAASKIFPQLAKGAIGEGGGLHINETAKAYKEGLMLGMTDAAQVMKKESHGKSDLDVLFGKSGDLPPEAIDFFGQLHSAIKAPFKRVIFERQLEKRLRRNLANGVDISDPMVQTSILTDAYKDANRAIFMQDNTVADGWRKLINHFDNVDPRTGKAPSKIIATTMQWMVPFVKVPTNIVAETARGMYGLPVGAAQALHATFTNGIDKLSPDQKDIVLRNLKKGTLGAAALALGYFNSQNFGGYYQQGQKRKEDEPEALGLKLFGVKIPAWFAESPIFQIMQFGATVRRVSDRYVKGEKNDIGDGLMAGLTGIVDHVPMASQPMRISSLFRSKADRDYYLGELAKSTVDPAIVSYLAKVTDPADEGSILGKIIAPENKRKSPKTTWEHIKSGLPYLREDLPEK